MPSAAWKTAPLICGETAHGPFLFFGIFFCATAATALPRAIFFGKKGALGRPLGCMTLSVAMWRMRPSCGEVLGVVVGSLFLARILPSFYAVLLDVPHPVRARELRAVVTRELRAVMWLNTLANVRSIHLSSDTGMCSPAQRGKHSTFLQRFLQLANLSVRWIYIQVNSVTPIRVCVCSLLAVKAPIARILRIPYTQGDHYFLMRRLIKLSLSASRVWSEGWCFDKATFTCSDIQEDGSVEVSAHVRMCAHV